RSIFPASLSFSVFAGLLMFGLTFEACIYRNPKPPDRPEFRDLESVKVQRPRSYKVERIAFGSCAKEFKKQPILETVLRYAPHLFIYLGDNIYGDTENMDKLRAKYRKLALKPEFRRLRSAVPVLATWDDHDYGENDAGRYYPRKAESREIFLDFWGEPEDSERRKHAGIYHALEYGKPAERVQVILLDNRTFRDNLLKHNDKKFLNDYRPNPSPDSTFLGAEQWAWLEQQFLSPARVRIIASSNQFSHEYNGWESWRNVPREQEKMLSLIKKTKAEGVVFISGDVHWGEISVEKSDSLYPIYDVTSSGITQSWSDIEENKNRIGKAQAENNFGLISIDWGEADPTLLMEVRTVSGAVSASHKVRLSELAF
ncbi:MAG: alkaline phosphatase D family protein, partial [Bacteroidota bacterium]